MLMSIVADGQLTVSPGGARPNGTACVTARRGGLAVQPSGTAGCQSSIAEALHQAVSNGSVPHQTVRLTIWLHHTPAQRQQFARTDGDARIVTSPVGTLADAPNLLLPTLRAT